MEGWTFTRETFEEELEKIKVQVAGALVDANLIDPKKADEWCSLHTILMRKHPIFRRLIGSLSGKKEGYYYVIVKRWNK